MLLSDGSLKHDNKDTWGRSNDEVQRSLDVLDKVLSEFDDITNEKFEDALSDKDENKLPPTLNQVEFETSVEFPNAPPVDRTLKPSRTPSLESKSTPPALPTKLRKIQSNPNIVIDSESLEQTNKDNERSRNDSDINENKLINSDSLKKSASETSSHEYQEINSDLINSPRRSKSLPRQDQPKGVYYNEDKKLRKSRSQIIDDSLRKHRLNDSRSSGEKSRRREFTRDKITKQPKTAFPNYPYPPHIENELRYQELLKYASLDPYVMDQINRMAFDAYQYNEYLVNSQLEGVDPRALLLQEELLHRYPYLLNNPIVYPHMFPNDSHSIDYPDVVPHSLSYPMYPVLPPELHHPYDLVYDDEIDPRLTHDHDYYPPNLPPDYPLEFGIHPLAHLGMDKHLQDHIKLPQMDPSIIPSEIEQAWLLPEEEQLALSHWRNWSHIVTDHRKTGFAKHYNLNENGNVQPYSYPHEMRSHISRQQRRGKKGGNEELNFGDETSFRVGDPVNCQEMKEKVQPNGPFSIGGKDSGFDEGIVIEDLSGDRKSPFPGTGGNMIVSGVFNDSSKMYIPAPPSPAPDYNAHAIDSDCESDILQKALYDEDFSKGHHKSRSKKKEGISKMMKDFHKGLPPPHESGSYSDDSLEDSSVSPSRPSTIGANTKMSASIESLSSVDDSIASFHYVGAGIKKDLIKNKDKRKDTKTKLKENKKSKYAIAGSKSCDFNSKINSSNSKLKQKAAEKSKSNEDVNKKTGQPKFDTIRNLIKEGLLEGLDEKPPDFKPPPPEKVGRSLSEERPDSGMGSRGSTAKSNDSVNINLTGSNSFSNSSSTHKTNEKRIDDILRRKSSKSPAPKPPVMNNSSSIQHRPLGNSSWLYKQKRPAPQPVKNPNSQTDKVTHVDDVHSSMTSDFKKSKENVHKYMKVSKENDDNKSTNSFKISKEVSSEDTIERNLNYPVFSGPLSSPGLNKKPPIEKIKVAPDKDNDVRLRLIAEFKDNLDNKLASEISKRTSMGTKLNQNLTSKTSKIEKHEENKKSYFSEKLYKEEESTKSRFNIFKGLWRKNKYSLDKA